MRTKCATGLVLSMVAVAASAGAEPLLELGGRVALLDGAVPGGVRVSVGLDLDRDGDLNSFELVQGSVSADGTYALSYTPDPTSVDLEFVRFVGELLADYNARGFEAVLDDGPLPIVLRFEREGYSTIVKRFTTLSEFPRLDVVLAPLAPVHCADEGCLAPDGSVRISGFPGGTGIARAYARAYDPAENPDKFPGVFADRAGNLLISSGFTEVDLRDSSGRQVTRLSSPVDVRFEARRASWASLRDLEAGSGLVEVPMYAFDEDSGEWVPEPNGELENADGSKVSESDFAAITSGRREDPLYIAFRTSHFSTFNCDAPNTRRACVKGRLTFEGEAVAGAHVSVYGVSYTGTAGTVFTGADGTFATDVMKSEDAGEDADGNGREGETFTARVTASGGVGVFVGATFDTPSVRGSVSAGARSCLPADCDCIDLGDIEGEFELPRACEITVRVHFSGEHVVGSGGPLDEGDAVAGARVTGQLSGGLALPIDDTLCGAAPCGTGNADDDGTTTFVVPVIGDEPQIEVRAEWSTTSGDDLHYYTASTIVAGCAEGESSLSADVRLEAQHAGMDDLGGYIEALGDGPPVPTGDGGLVDEIEDQLEPPRAPSCGCRTAGSRGELPFALLTAAMTWLAFAHRRKRTPPRNVD